MPATDSDVLTACGLLSVKLSQCTLGVLFTVAKQPGNVLQLRVVSKTKVKLTNRLIRCQMMRNDGIKIRESASVSVGGGCRHV